MVTMRADRTLVFAERHVSMRLCFSLPIAD